MNTLRYCERGFFGSDVAAFLSPQAQGGPIHLGKTGGVQWGLFSVLLY